MPTHGARPTPPYGEEKTLRREIVIAWRKGSSRAVEGAMLAEAFKDSAA